MARCRSTSAWKADASPPAARATRSVSAGERKAPFTVRNMTNLGVRRLIESIRGPGFGVQAARHVYWEDAHARFHLVWRRERAPAERRHHRARGPWQNDPGRRSAAPER